MPLPSRFWADLKSPDFAALDPAATVAVLPVAAIEQHGPHLPLSVDQTLADGIVAAALPLLPAQLPVLVLPTQQVGYSPEHTAFAGTLTLSAATLIANWTEIGQCVARAGVKKLLLFNSHGGQASLLDVVARELRGRAGLIVYGCNWWNLPLGAAADAFSAQEHRFGVHAGEIETSMMLALRPQRVDMGQAADFGSTSRRRAEHNPVLGNGRSAKLGWHMQDYNPQGAAGNAAAADATRGKALVEAAGSQLALLLRELSALPLDTLAP
ncbi:MAG TPA: creatininase family protein [Ramlibacter sp.]|nr:creatininase family protein [Ramlibacter sp.]